MGASYSADLSLINCRINKGGAVCEEPGDGEEVPQGGFADHFDRCGWDAQFLGDIFKRLISEDGSLRGALRNLLGICPTLIKSR